MPLWLVHLLTKNICTQQITVITRGYAEPEKREYWQNYYLGNGLSITYSQKRAEIDSKRRKQQREEKENKLRGKIHQIYNKLSYEAQQDVKSVINREFCDD